MEKIEFEERKAGEMLLVVAEEIEQGTVGVVELEWIGVLVG